MTPEFSNVDEILRFSLEELQSRGKQVSPRGSSTREIINFSFSLNDPLSRLVHCKRRNWSAPLALGEFCWHTSASNSLADISYYASNWACASDDENTIEESCYGKKLFSKVGGSSNWENLRKLLKADPMTRRAVFSFHKLNTNFFIHTSDVTCTSSIQFLIRNSRLHLIVTMRSNDVIWGLPYDIFFFTMLQERMSLELGLQIGTYHHTAGSFHLYERHYRLSETILQEKPPSTFRMKRMGVLEQLETFLETEKKIRENTSSDNPFCNQSYWRGPTEVLRLFSQSKRNKTRERKTIYLNLLSD